MNPPPLALRVGRLVPGDAPPVDDAIVAIEAGVVRWLGPAADAPPDLPPVVHHAGRLITPGLVDAHTHAAWTGSRHAEYAVRLAGGSYEEIAKAGGGILSSQRAIAAATEAELAATLIARLRRMASLGVTAVEVKSGYGLTCEHELKQLRAIARAATQLDLPRVVPTFLALHAAPKDRARDAYLASVRDETLPAVLAEGLARYVDAYLDRNAFSVAEARPMLETARAAGLGVRLHVGQFADVGGAELAAELGARSVDHVEHLSAAAAEALARAGTTAVLLPTASFTLVQAPPDVALLRRAGVALAVASDANPGTAPSESLPLAMAMGARLYGLTPDEVLGGATWRAADALELPAAGRLRVGAPADLVLWDLPHEHALLQPWGVAKAAVVLRDGRRIGGTDT